MPEPMRPLKVFLCHAKADKLMVRELHRYLRKRGVKPWLDEVDLLGGQDWQLEIPKALATSDVIIVCLSRNSVDKEGYIQKEIKFALDKALEMPEGRIFLIPVRFEECEVPFSLSRYQWVDLFDQTGYSRMMKALRFRALQLERAPIEFQRSSSGPEEGSAHAEGEKQYLEPTSFSLEPDDTKKTISEEIEYSSGNSPTLAKIESKSSEKSNSGISKIPAEETKNRNLPVFLRRKPLLGFLGISSIFVLIGGTAIILMILSPLLERIGQVKTVTPTASRTMTPELVSSPTQAFSSTSTMTPTIPLASSKDVNVNCRLGPSTGWIPVSALIVGQSSQIIGKSVDGSRWYIVDPQDSSRHCWVQESVVNATGDLASIPVVEDPEASVTNVIIDVTPKTINIPGCIGPIPPSEITGTIETNGPTTVKWHFETQLGGNVGNQNTNFDAFGTREFDADYTPPLTEGTYWIRLIVTEPNDMQAEVEYEVEC